MKKAIWLSLVSVGLVASVLGVGTYAFFSDTETSTGNTMTAGTLDLWVNGGDLDDNTETTLITLEDLKPSFTHYAPEVTLRIVDNPGKLYKMITDISCEGGTNPEPEWEVDGGFDEQGVAILEDDNQFTDDTWFDLHIGWTDEAGVSHINDCLMGTENKVGYYANKWIYLGEYPALTDVGVKQSFHMDKGVGNEHQGDVCTFTEKFMVLQTNAPGPEDGDVVVDCTIKPTGAA